MPVRWHCLQESTMCISGQKFDLTELSCNKLIRNQRHDRVSLLYLKLKGLSICGKRSNIISLDEYVIV